MVRRRSFVGPRPRRSTSCSGDTSATSTGRSTGPSPRSCSSATSQRGPVGRVSSAPTGFIHPVIDGELTNYFEWVGAGSVEVAPVGDAMHEVADAHGLDRAVEFGFDLENLYVRSPAASPMRDCSSRRSASEPELPEAERVPDRRQRRRRHRRGAMANVGADGPVPPNLPGHPGRGRTRLWSLQVPFQCLGVSTDRRSRSSSRSVGAGGSGTLSASPADRDASPGPAVPVAELDGVSRVHSSRHSL